jgi:hypothetical protein
MGTCRRRGRRPFRLRISRVVTWLFLGALLIFVILGLWQAINAGRVKDHRADTAAPAISGGSALIERSVLLIALTTMPDDVAPRAQRPGVSSVDLDARLESLGRQAQSEDSSSYRSGGRFTIDLGWLVDQLLEYLHLPVDADARASLGVDGSSVEVSADAGLAAPGVGAGVNALGSVGVDGSGIEVSADAGLAAPGVGAGVDVDTGASAEMDGAELSTDAQVAVPGVDAQLGVGLDLDLGLLSLPTTGQRSQAIP